MSTVRFILVALLVGIVSGCDGGGGGDVGDVGDGVTPETVSPAGIWGGTDANGRRIAALVLDTGDYYSVYSSEANSNVIAGLVQGTGTSSGDQFNSSDGVDFNFEGNGNLAGTLTATVDFQNTFNGSFTETSDTSNPVIFNTTFNPLYNETPSLGAIAGTYDGQLDSILGPEFNIVGIDSGGVITATGSGCISTGTIAPSATGNTYDVQITFGMAFCALPNQTVSGAGTYDPSEKFLIIALVTSDRSNGAVYTGAKR